MRPLIAIDCDGVLSDWHALAFPILNKLMNTSLSTQDVKNWDIYDLIDDQSIKDIFSDSLNKSGMIEHLPIHKGAQEGIEKIKEIADIYIVTAPMNDYHDWIIHRNKWLKKNFDISPKNIVHTSAKYLIPADIFIDDKPENVEKWMSRNVGIPVLWKHECVPNPNIFLGRAKHTNNWDDIVTMATKTLEMWI